MSEPVNHPDNDLHKDDSPPTTAVEPLLSDPVLDLGQSLPPSDESPTVISRQPVRPVSSESALASSLRGRRLAHFELIAPVGVGGMAAVIKARDLQLDRIVALKILPPDMANDPENVRRFHQEARAAAKLDHENIARVFYCGEDQNLHFIAFEFVQGENLRAILERRGRLPVAESIHYLLQIATGLAHAASRDVVHRDIKPSNIIITSNGRAKLVDMGLARSLAPHEDHGLTQSGVTLGTFDYISPEQALEPRDADVRSDIYSLGCTFYHLLTGQPPVPEGTAARKLHHHQNVNPVDPRQLVPEIPDDVALILAKMMAKNPGDRYQRPEHLVQQLLRVAQRFNAVAESPEGLLFVDAPVATTPTTRPLLLAALGVAAIVTLIVVLGQPSHTQRPPFPLPRALANPDNKDRGPARPTEVGELTGPVKPPGSPGTGSSPTTGVATFVYENQGHRELREFLRKQPPNSEVDIVLVSDLVLPGEGADKDDPGLVFRGRKITIRARDRRPTIWFTYDGYARKSSQQWAALLFEAEDVHLQGLRLVVNALEAQRMMGVLLRGGRRHLLEDCQFFQVYPTYRDDQRLESLVVDTSRPDSRPSVMVRDCSFVGAEEVETRTAAETVSSDPLVLRRIGRGGHIAVTRNGPVNLQMQHCSFGPHLACLRLDGITDTEQTVSVQHCSAILGDNSAFFLVADKATARVQTSLSLFSRPGRSLVMGSEPGTARGAMLIRQLTEDATAFLYLGEDNRYHNLDGFWVRGASPDSVASFDWDDFITRLRETSGQDEKSQTLDTSPWVEDDPLAALGSLKLARAFHVHERQRDLRATGNEQSLIGVERCAGLSYVSNLPRLTEKKPTPLTRKEKVVDPSITQAGNGSYVTLRQALEEAQPGDVILIKHNGVLASGPVRLEKSNLELTIRPAPGCRPVLALESQEREAALFQVQEGKLTFKQMTFLLQPTENGTGMRSLVAMVGDGTCRFEECVITLGEPRGNTLGVVTLADQAAVMMKKPAQSAGPRLSFENCLVRGKGDLLWCRSSRPFKLEASHLLVALTGSLIEVEGAREESQPLAEASRAQATVELHHVTACHQDHLLQLRGSKDLKNFVPFQWKPSNCLFVSLTGKSLVHLEGMDVSDEKLKEKLTWEGSRNAYGNFMDLLDQQPRGTDMRPPAYGEDRWKTFTGESDARFERVKFATPPEPNSLQRVRPMQFQTIDLQDFGANLEQVPTPPTEERPATDAR